MLAGLLIATHDAEDRPGTLTATLPFGGVTLIEYQARLLIAAGASQIVIMVARLTPELLGAISRLGRRGITVDTVRSAAEAAEKLHPLARVVMLADGLTTTPDVVAAMAREGGDALLVASQEDGALGFERVGGGAVWAGVARVDPRRMGELAALPRDYDMQSTMVRLASQARAVHVMLPPEAVRQGHGIDHRAETLAVRGRSVLSAAVSRRSGWFDRLIIAPLARLVVPLLVPRNVPVIGLAGGAGGAGLIGLGLIWGGLVVIGLLLALFATIALALTGLLADLRDEDGNSRTIALAAIILPGFAVLLDGREAMAMQANGAPVIVAVALVVAAALGERGLRGGKREWWWGGPAAYLMVATVGAVIAMPVVGLGLAALYATATLGALIERLRQHP